MKLDIRNNSGCSMEILRNTALILLWMLGLTYAQDIYVAAPSSLRLDTYEKIMIGIDGAKSETVRIVVYDYPAKRKTIFSANVPVQPGRPIISRIKLDAVQFPSGFLAAPGTPKLVSLYAFIGNTWKIMQVPITNQSGYMFIQTDKPIYTPQERASFRIIPLTEEGLPSNERFQLQIKDPEGFVLDEKFFNERNIRLPNYFATHTFGFPKNPRLGDWTAVVRYGKNLEQNSSVSFEVLEYVLPTFTVTVTTREIILEKDAEITIDVEANYVYGQKVNGIVSFRFGVKSPRTSNVTYFGIQNSRALVGGARQVKISTNDLKTHRNIGWFPRIDGYSFVIEATVVDVATGERVEKIDASARFSKSPFIISFKRCLSDFKPGLRSIFEADITYVDGKPAVGIATKLSAVADNGKRLNIIQSTSTSNGNGRVAFEIHPEIHHKTVQLTLETTQQGYAGSQARGTYVQRAYSSKNKAYIAISRSTPLRLRPGDIFRRDIYLEPIGIQNIYYLVVARGKIQTVGKLPPGQYIVQRFEFAITHEMVPNFRVVVFAHHGNDLVADSLRIDVEKICSPNAQVTLEEKFDHKEPGRGGKIIITGTKDTAVGLLGVDEAVYAISRRNRLTKEKIFDRLVSHDLGCGPGGGLDINGVLGNAGIMLVTNKFTPSHSHSCVEVKRRKRSIGDDIVSRYTGKEKVCCGLGFQSDKHNSDCDEKYFVVEKELDEIHENCSSIYLECCREAEEQEIIGSVYIPEGFLRGLGENFDVLRVLNDDMEEDFERETTIRRDFKETWVNLDFLIGSDKKKELEISLPHSITTWVIQAVSLSPTDGMCVAEPQKLVSFKKIFLQLNLPYSIKQFEQVEVQATVFNYEDKDITVYVYMYGVEGICSGTEPGKKSERQRLEIKSKSARAVTFPIVPLKAEDIPIKFYAQSADGRDIIEKKLHVVPQGVKEEANAVIRLDPMNLQKRAQRDITKELYFDSIDSTKNLHVAILNLSLPEGTVPGTAKCLIKATGDTPGPAVDTSIKNPDGLINMPSGCAEQNMARFAPTVYALKYLKSVGNLTAVRRDRGYGFIRTGYNNMLKYRKTEGGYSGWGSGRITIWLTSFVLKVFCQGTEFVPTGNNVISSGIGWLVSKQEADGSFTEKNYMYYQNRMAGFNGKVFMTSYALITLTECKNHHQNLLLPTQRATAFLVRHRTIVQTPLSSAVLAYALALTNSNEKHAAKDKLLETATHDPNKNHLFWTIGSMSERVETAGYALLTLLLFNDTGRSTAIVNWLMTIQQQSGRFYSTQDTMIALQALSEYAIRVPSTNINMVSSITWSRDNKFHKVLKFNVENAHEVQGFKIDDPDGKLFVNTTGNGMGTLSMKLEYTVIKPEHEICKFDIKLDIKEVVNIENMARGVIKALDKDHRRRRQANEAQIEGGRDKKKNNNDLSLNINICIRYLGNNDTEMSIADVGIFSGYQPVIKDLERLEKDEKHYIQKYEKLNNGIVFYLEKVPTNQDYCFSFQVYREYIVGNTQSSMIKVYDYYNPDVVCTKFYSPSKNSILLSKICDDGVCECAEGGCTPKSPFADIMKENSAATRREKLTEYFCEEFDFVWKGKLKGRPGKIEQFLNVSFEITEVIKAGTEKKADLENKVRYLRAQEHCETAYFFPGAIYLIAGRDPPPRPDGYKYLINKSSIVHHWATTDESVHKNLKRDLNHVTEQLKNKGCEQ